MNKRKSHFWYNKRQRNGISFLLVLIVLFQLIYFNLESIFNKATPLVVDGLDRFQSQVDSLKLIEIENRKPKIYPYNPSFISDYKGYQLGMSTEEIDRLLSHRSNGEYINSAKHFQKVTRVSDSLLAVMSPNFKFPEWVVAKEKAKKNTLIYNKVETYEHKRNTRS